jgi:hypothetical protein
MKIHFPFPQTLLSLLLKHRKPQVLINKIFLCKQVQAEDLNFTLSKKLLPVKTPNFWTRKAFA